ncbi:MAG: hypothetical protein OHK0029_01270 [Armatimonadaceae bacterium]
MAPREALDIARERGLDLIEVAPDAQPPVCRIMDYGKYKYEQGKREREAAKKQRQSEMKGMTLRPGTDDHDLDIKTKNILRFLSDGDKVKVTVRFRARELAHPEFAEDALKKIIAAVEEEGNGVVERAPSMEGRQMIMILAPQRNAAKKAAPAPKPATNGGAKDANVTDGVPRAEAGANAPRNAPPPSGNVPPAGDRAGGGEATAPPA